jgi:hypothetical protein
MAVAAILLPGAVEKAIGQGRDQPSGSGMMMGGMKHGMMGGMGGMKMSGPMKMRHQMMMNMEVTPQDPAALLALKGQLKLSEEQTKRLQAILTQARQQAEQVLTDEQKTQLQPLEKLPKTMMQMMEHMGHEQPAAKGGATGHVHQH